MLKISSEKAHKPVCWCCILSVEIASVCEFANVFVFRWRSPSRFQSFVGLRVFFSKRTAKRSVFIGVFHVNVRPLSHIRLRIRVSTTDLISNSNGKSLTRTAFHISVRCAFERDERSGTPNRKCIYDEHGKTSNKCSKQTAKALTHSHIDTRTYAHTSHGMA